MCSGRNVRALLTVPGYAEDHITTQTELPTPPSAHWVTLRMPLPQGKVPTGPRAGASRTPYATSSCEALATALLMAWMQL